MVGYVADTEKDRPLALFFAVSADTPGQHLRSKLVWLRGRTGGLDSPPRLWASYNCACNCHHEAGLFTAKFLLTGYFKLYIY